MVVPGEEVMVRPYYHVPRKGGSCESVQRKLPVRVMVVSYQAASDTYLVDPVVWERPECNCVSVPRVFQIRGDEVIYG